MSMTVQTQPDRPDPTVIATQNDAFRKLACLGVAPAQPTQGRMHVARSLMEAGDGFMAEAVKATGAFGTFEPENDPEDGTILARSRSGARPCSGKSISMRQIRISATGPRPRTILPQPCAC